jgi:hypothetical protein
MLSNRPEEAIAEIVCTPGKALESQVQAISTDNIGADGNKLEALMERLLPGTKVYFVQVRTRQSAFHNLELPMSAVYFAVKLLFGDSVV